MLRFRIVALSVCICILTGCGRDGFAPVHGQLLYPDGSPAKDLEGFNIVFEGTAADGRGYSSLGIIDAEGKFPVFTNKPGDGPPVGLCRVLIEPKMIDSEREFAYPIDSEYRSFETSGLTFEVQNGKNTVQFTVEPSKKNP